MTKKRSPLTCCELDLSREKSPPRPAGRRGIYRAELYRRREREAEDLRDTDEEKQELGLFYMGKMICGLKSDDPGADRRASGSGCGLSHG